MKSYDSALQAQPQNYKSPVQFQMSSSTTVLCFSIEFNGFNMPSARWCPEFPESSVGKRVVGVVNRARCAAGQGGCSDGNGTSVLARIESVSDAITTLSFDGIVEGNEMFSRKLFSELRAPPASNLIFSPFSASTVSDHFVLPYFFVIWDLE